jgi:hypothetical protein
MNYNITVPNDGLYTLDLGVSFGGARIFDASTSTGYWAEDTFDKTSGTEVRTFSVPVPLKAGVNTITISQPELTDHNTDYLRVTDTGNKFGTLSGTVHNTAGGAAEAGVRITVTDANSKIVGKTVSAADGTWTVLAGPGDYSVTASKSGFDGTTATATVSVGTTATATVSVTPSDTITIVPSDLSAIFNGYGAVPRVYYPYAGSPTNSTVGFFERDCWIEFPFTVTKPGLYSLTMDIGSATGSNRVVTADVRQDGSNQHFTTKEIVMPITGDYHTFSPFTADDQIPLKAGKYILRLQNVSDLHDPAPATPLTASASTNVGRVTFNRVGDAPATAGLSGTVTSSDLGTPVASARVLANLPGSEVVDPSPFSYHGYWTMTDATGKYQLAVPAGSYSVQAGRPDTYIKYGATVPVTVAAGGATANLSLLSNWVSGTIKVEDEYYFDKIAEAPGSGSGTGIQLIPDATSSNGFRLGALNSEDYVLLHVDVPPGQAGDYSVTAFYFTPTVATAQMRLVANNGSAVQELLPPVADVTAPAQYTFTQPIHLNAGMNTIKQWMFTPEASLGTDIDAIQLTRVATPLTPAAKALRIAGGLDAATLDDMSTLNVVTTGSSASVIDIQDAVTLAQQG